MHAPAAAWILGLITGAFHLGFTDTFTESMVLMVCLVVLGAIASGLAAWLAIGCAMGDLLLATSLTAASSGSHLLAIAAKAGSLLIVYALMLSLAVFIPQAARGVGRSIRLPARFQRLRASAAACSTIASAVTSAILAVVWVHAAPTLIRPAFTWLGQAPTVAAMHPLQDYGMTLVSAAALAQLARIALERMAPSIRTPPVDIAGTRLSIRNRDKRQQERAPWLRISIQVVLTTFMLAGVMSSWVDAAIVGSVQIALHILRFRLVGRLRGISQSVQSIPLVLRYGVWLLVSYVAAHALVGLLWSKDDSFRPIIYSIAVSLLVFALLFPVNNSKREKAK
jgi:hypothetical protein